MTVIESRVKRSFWKNAALSAIPDLLIAWAFMKYTDGGAETLFFTLIALQATYFTLWAKRSIWSWTLFVLTDRAFMSNLMRAAMSGLSQTADMAAAHSFFSLGPQADYVSYASAFGTGSRLAEVGGLPIFPDRVTFP